LGGKKGNKSGVKENTPRVRELSGRHKIRWGGGFSHELQEETTPERSSPRARMGKSKFFMEGTSEYDAVKKEGEMEK